MILVPLHCVFSLSKAHHQYIISSKIFNQLEKTFWPGPSPWKVVSSSKTAGWYMITSFDIYYRYSLAGIVPRSWLSFKQKLYTRSFIVSSSPKSSCSAHYIHPLFANNQRHRPSFTPLQNKWTWNVVFRISQQNDKLGPHIFFCEHIMIQDVIHRV